jgi:hypothetical protein
LSDRVSGIVQRYGVTAAVVSGRLGYGPACCPVIMPVTI